MMDNVGAGTTQDKDVLFQIRETTRIQYLHHLMFRQHTCNKWAQQHMVKASLVGAAGPCGSEDIPKVARCLHRGKSALIQPQNANTYIKQKKIDHNIGTEGGV